MIATSAPSSHIFLKNRGWDFIALIHSFITYLTEDNPSPPNLIKVAIQVNKGESNRLTNYAKKTSIISVVSAKLGNSIKSQHEMLSFSI